MQISGFPNNSIYNVNQPGSSLPYSQLGIQGISTVPIAIPDGIIIRKRVAQEYGIEILDSDVKFTSAECAAIEETLSEIRKKKKTHLIGVRQVIKNQQYRVKLLSGLRIDAGGAYDADSKRVYIFDNVPIEDIPEVLTHEVGHAVSHFNLEFEKFMEFVKDSGYNMVEFRKYFVPGNQMYNIGLKKVPIPKENWQELINRFSMKTLAQNQDLFGELVLELSRKKRYPWDENPLEAFAWAYEWYVNRNPEFKNQAFRAAEHGDSTWLRDYEFLEKEVFEE
jgi:hypothetical protein